MTDTTNAPVMNTIEVPRNDVTWKFAAAKLKKGKGNKDGADKFAFIPVEAKTLEEKLTFLKWIGVEQQYYQSKSRTRGMSINWSRSAVDDKTGEFNEVEFVKYASEFSARGETIKSLLAEKEELNARIIKLSADSTVSMPDKVAQFTEIGKRLQEIEETIEFKKRSTKDGDEEDEEVDSSAA